MLDISIVLGIVTIIYLVYFRPKLEDAEEKRIFDNRVLGFVDGLYASGMKFGCTDSEMRIYVTQMLNKAHKLPGNQTLLEHTIRSPNRPGIDGRTYRSHIGLHGEHIHFALLCIIHRVDSYYRADTIVQCEQLLLETPDFTISY